MAVLTDTSPEGFRLGMVTAVPGHRLPDGAAQYLQDVFVHKPGFSNRRGPLETVTGMVAFTKPISGLVSTFNPQGVFKAAALEGDAGVGYLSVLSADRTAKTQIPFDSVFPTAPYRIVDAKPRMGGGIWISVATQYDGTAPTQYLAFWYGCDKLTYTTGTVTATRGSTAVTGSGTSWTSGTAEGAFLFDNSGQLVGTVKKIVSNTSITLEKPALVSIAGAAYSLKPFRGMSPRVSTGRITTTTTAASVLGTNTRFIDQALNTGTWDIFRLSDLLFVGTVSSVASATALTLTGNAALALTDELYVAILRGGDYGTTITASKPGFLTATYAQRQWYADSVGSKVYAADPDDPEAVDLTSSGFIPVTSGYAQNNSSSIRNIVPTLNSLLVLKETEAFGIFGDDDANFELRRIADDGTLSAMSVQAWNGDVLYAGRTGIWLYDGQSAENITINTLGDYYNTAVRTFDPSTYRMWSALINDYYFLFIENATPNVSVVKNNVATSVTKLTIGIHLPTKAVALYTNLNLRGALVPPASTGQNTWVAVNDSTKGWIAPAASWFDKEGVDSIACDGGTAGPDMFIRSRAMDFGDALRKKIVKQFAMEYEAAGDGIKYDSILDLNDSSSAALSTFPVSQYTWTGLGATYSTWTILGAAYATWTSLSSKLFVARRIKFRKTAHHYAFSLYQASNAVTSARIGPWSLAYKVKRAGAI